MKKLLFFFFVAIFLLSGCNKKNEISQIKQPGYETDFSKYFEGYSGAFVLYDVNNKYYIRHNEEQCNKRLSPCSTFKIPSSLIALETGVATDENFLLKWDGTKQPFESWNRDHTLKTAIANSVVWYYRELARRIGEEKMKEYVQKINYGNMDISGGLDKFWLMSSIEISANEQVEFLYKLYKNELPFSERTINIVKDIMTLEKTDKFVLRGKTGSSGDMENYSQGWFVGYITHENNAFIFATNIIAPKDASGIKAKAITYEILKSLKLM
ncbi:MAG: class D beta-lactamase [Ignavibacteria bacterium]|jgi:beta-lactamase class D